MSIDVTKQIADELVKQLEAYEPHIQAKRVGHVLSVADGVVKVSGLSHGAYLEKVRFSGGVEGFIINLEEDEVGIIVLGEYTSLKEGDEVETTGELLSVPVGEEFLGRVINPLGEPIDGKGAIHAKKKCPIEKIAPGVITRKSVTVPLQTGIKAIDAMIPIGRGQRELIIGDRNTGKTTIAVDTIINQGKSSVVSRQSSDKKDKSLKSDSEASLKTESSPVICIYVAIGQKSSKIAQLVAKLEEHGAMDHTIVVSASASDPAPMQYLAPYSGTAIGEYFMDQGKDALIIYDDLSKHAWAYRQISLLLRRPPGREAYPGDVFYLHSRLLERACQLSSENGGGSLTALPIIETQAQDVSANIPTNVISITDGQIYLESDLFFAGVRPALNVGLSVSRIGGAAQVKAMKKVAGKLRLDLSQYYELATFAQFATDLDSATKEKIERGKRIVEILKQDQYVPYSTDAEILVIYLATSGFLDDVPLNLIREFEKSFLDFVDSKHKVLTSEILKKGELDEKLEKRLIEIITEFKNNFSKIHNISKEEDGKSKTN